MKKPILLSILSVSIIGIPVEASDFDVWLGPSLSTTNLKQQLRNNQRISGQRRDETRKTTTRKRSKRTKAAPSLVVESYPEVRVNGQILRSSVKPVTRNGYAFVPFRELFTALGANVQFDAGKRLITATRGPSTMQLRLPGSDAEMQGNRVRHSNAAEPFMRNGATMIPLRFVSEKMGATVNHVQGKTGPYISIESEPV